MSERIMSASVFDEEAALEYEAVDEGVKRYFEQAADATKRGEAALLKPVERLLTFWMAPVRKAVAREVRWIRERRPAAHRAIYGPVLHLVDPTVSAAIAIREVLSQTLQGDGVARMTNIAYDVGNAVIAEVHLNAIRENKAKKEEWEKVVKRVKRLNPFKVNHFAKEHLDAHFWSIRVATKLGVCLIWAVLQNAVVPGKDDKLLAAFVVRRRSKSYSEVHMTDAAAKIIADGHSARQFMRPRYLPMLCPPAAWTFDKGGSLLEGGYLKIRTPLMTRPTRAQKEAILKHKPTRALDAINTLGFTPLQLNGRVFDAQEACWDAGGNELDIPRAEPLPLPPRPDDFETNDASKTAWKVEATKIHRKNRIIAGERATYLSTVDVARRVANRSAFYMPQQMDFRGRTYPIPLFLTHIGGDVPRSLFQFSRAVPASSASAQGWIHVHAANCYGIDKVPFAERVEWVKKHATEIDRTCRDPQGSEWWRQAKKPWQFLAACFALNDRKLAERLPIQVDATCSGLQHYAAVARDAECGYEVNLVDRPAPGDAYRRVAGSTRPLLEADAGRGIRAAQLILPHFDRDWTKSNVMTKLYNVTPYGATDQHLDRLRDLGLEGKDLYDSARYLATMVLGGVREAFPRAMAFMEWIEAAARAIMRKHGDRTIEFVSPIGLPVVFPYYRRKVVQVAASRQRLSLEVDNPNDPPKKARQVNGAPPHIIHSFDASHKMEVALACRKHDIDFIDVHDNFWAHAGNMDAAGPIYREEFIRMHEANPLDSIRDQWVRLYPEASIPELPARGSLDLAALRLSTYFMH